MTTERWVRTAAIGVSVTVGLLAAGLFLRYFFGILLPFLLAALIASLLRPASRFLSRRLRLPEKLGGTLLILGAVTLLSFGLIALGRFLFEEVREGITALPALFENPDNPLRRFIDLLNTWNGDNPAAAGEAEALYGMLSGMVGDAVSAVSTALTDGAGAILVKLPRVLLSLVVGVIALFYLFFDQENLLAKLRRLFGKQAAERLTGFFTRTRKMLGDCMKAYLSLLALTFCGLLTGFLLLNVSRPFAAAAVVALVDLLPVLGVGTVLLPWGILSLFSGDIFRGMGMFILWAVLYILRQFAEPRLLGSTVGVHPLLSLFAVFAGFSLFGLPGALLSPLFLYGGKVLLESITQTKKGGEP